MNFENWRREKLTAYAKANTSWRISFEPKKNRDFYFNKNTNKSQWSLPEELQVYDNVLRKEYDSLQAITTEGKRKNSIGDTEKSVHDSAQKKQRLLETIAKDTSFTMKPRIPVSNLSREAAPASDAASLYNKSTPDALASNVVDPVQAQIDFEAEKKRVEGILLQKDAIMERDVIENVKALIHTYKEPPATVVKSLVTSYKGYAQMARVVLEWIQLAEDLEAPLTRTTDTSSSSSVSSATGGTDGTETTASSAPQTSNGSVSAATRFSVPPLDARSEEKIVELVSDMIRQRFNRKLADELVLQFRSTPPWLRDLLRDEAFRAVIADLHSRNRSSTFLSLCMREVESIAGEDSALRNSGRVSSGRS